MISFDVGDEKFNFRVCGLILNSARDKFLINTAPDIDFAVLPGGRVEMSEDTAVALKREFMEELGAEIEIVGLKSIIENFFYYEGKHFHELQFMYVAKLKDKAFEEKEGFFYGEEHKDLYGWTSIGELDELKYNPILFKKAIREVFENNYDFLHLVLRED